MIKNTPSLFCFLLLVPLFVSCAHSTPSSPRIMIDGPAIARSIVLCRTTETDLRSQLGNPTRDGIFHRQRVMSWITGSDSPVKYLAVLFDDRGVVVDLYWDIPTEIPWQPVNQCGGK